MDLIDNDFDVSVVADGILSRHEDDRNLSIEKMRRWSASQFYQVN